MAETKKGTQPEWALFPQDLFSIECLSKEYKYLNDEKVRREMGQEVRAKFLEEAAKSGVFDMEGGAVLLKGGTSALANYYDTDVEIAPFRQESFFQYLFGICEPDCYGVIFLGTKESVVFLPVLDEATFRWNGPPHTVDHYKHKYGLSAVYSVETLCEKMAERKVKTVYTLKGLNTDSGLSTALEVDMAALVTQKSTHTFQQDNKSLHPVLVECRVIKTPKEIAYMRECCRVSCQAHTFVMRHIKPGMAEMQFESMFKAFCGVYGGARHMAYTCICASGPHGAILHYGHAGRPNDRVTKNGDLIVLDMGGEYHGYCTDITASYPVNGKFTKDQASVHKAVQEAQQAVFSHLKPGTHWKEMHRLAERTILKHLLEMKVLKGATVDELMKHDMAAVFMPHGLGHFIGLDTHDVGGYPVSGSKKDMALGVRWLRTQRVLNAGMVLTVEPGLYFNEMWINQMLAKDEAKAKFVDQDVLKRFINMGGVRLEDVVVITETGYDNLTILPKTIEEYESIISKYTPTCHPCA